MSAAASSKHVMTHTTSLRDISDAQSEPIPASPEPINPDPTQADLQRRAEIDRAWSAYKGHFPEVFKTPNGDISDNIRPNRCAAIVDKGVSWLFGKPFTVKVRDCDEDGVAETGAKAADDDMDMDADMDAMDVDGDGENDQYEAALAKVWGNTDDMLTLLTMAAMNGGVSGHTFLKIVWDSQKMKYPRLSVLDSHNVYVLSDPDDVNRAVCYVIEYSARLGLVTGGLQRTVTKRQVIALVDPDGNARFGQGGEDDDDYWTITNWQRSDLTSPNATSSALPGQQQSWQMVGQPLEWRYPFPPIVDAMNLPNPNEFWGLADLPPALIDLNEKIHFIESNIAKIIKSNAHPWLFASGCDPSAIRNEPGVVQGLPSENSKVWAVTATGDLGNSMAFANDLRADMDEQSRVPAVALGRQESMPKGNLSGIALSLLFQPLIEKTELKRRLYGQLVRRASAYCLCLLGLIKDWRDVEVELEWQNLLPDDDLAMAQTAQTLQEIGYSQTTLIERTGGDPDTEATNKQEEQRQQLVAFSQGTGQPPMDAGALAQSAQMDDGADEGEENGDTTTTSSTTAGREEQPAQQSQQQPQQNTTPPRGKNTRKRNRNRNQGQKQQQQMPMMSPPLNHPQAQAARQKAAVVMKAAFGKR